MSNGFRHLGTGAPVDRRGGSRVLGAQHVLVLRADLIAEQRHPMLEGSGHDRSAANPAVMIQYSLIIGLENRISERALKLGGTELADLDLQPLC